MYREQSRIAWIDHMKVIGMFFIVLGHFFPGGGISSFLYAFNVPLFFMASGLLCTKKSSVRGIISKLLPLFLLIIVICSINYPYIIKTSSTNLAYYQFPLGLGGGRLEYLGTMWFVYALIALRLIHNFCIGHKWVTRGIIFLSLMVLLLLRYYYGVENYQYAWCAVLLALPFFELGYIIRTRNIILYFERLTNNVVLSNIVIVVFVIIIFIVGNVNGIVYVYNNDYGRSLLLFILTSMMGFSMCTIFSMIVNKFSPTSIYAIINNISRGNILILGFQGILIALSQDIIHYLISEKIVWSFLIIPLQFFASLLIMTMFYPLCALYCRYIEPLLFNKYK